MPHSLSPEYEWVQLSGKGKVYSFVTYCRLAFGLGRQAPYNVSLVDLDEGPPLISNVMRLPAGSSEDRHAGGSGYEDNEGHTLPKFRAMK